jgi:hypothetical protein
VARRFDDDAVAVYGRGQDDCVASRWPKIILHGTTPPAEISSELHKSLYFTSFKAQKNVRCYRPLVTSSASFADFFDIRGLVCLQPVYDLSFRWRHRLFSSVFPLQKRINR